MKTVTTITIKKDIPADFEEVAKAISQRPDVIRQAENEVKEAILQTFEINGGEVEVTVEYIGTDPKTTKRPAEIGEKIIIVETHRLSPKRLGEVYTVESRLGNIVNVKELTWSVMDIEYEVIEPENGNGSQ